MADLDLYCNFKNCRKRLNDYAWVTKCSHAFCEEDGRREFLGNGNLNHVDRKCPACGLALQKMYDVVKVNLDPPEEYKSMVLAGLRPEILADIMSRSLTFWTYQMYQRQLYQEAATRQARDSLVEFEKYYESVIHKIQNTLEHREKKLKELTQEYQSQNKIIADLKSRLAAKSREVQKSQQMYESMRRNSMSLNIGQNVGEVSIGNCSDSNRSQSSHQAQPFHDQHQFPSGFPFINHPQTTDNPPLPVLQPGHVTTTRATDQDFTFKPITPTYSSGKFSARNYSKRQRLEQLRRPHNSKSPYRKQRLHD